MKAIHKARQLVRWKLLELLLFWGTESEIQGHRGLRECSSEGDGIIIIIINYDY